MTTFIKILNGTDLRSADINGKSDPYVTVTFGEEKPIWRTWVQKKTLSPIWNQWCELEDVEGKLILDVWDWDKIGKHAFLGRAIVDLGEISVNELETLPLQLEKREGKKKDKAQGQIYLLIHKDPPSEVEPFLGQGKGNPMVDASVKIKKDKPPKDVEIKEKKEKKEKSEKKEKKEKKKKKKEDN
ncbi:tricalbin-1-related [Anaeramoeba flamelloides]|uniref:Tricalbin-1-related n=1 Tax=Anaeramoeba flamelloides TaxID=1746091 RepID=A0ABQ8ZD59_9EUKA|nr:tricalbin-1-related [Anaeramoeba flamelloides]